jgi:hypothetical protein
VRERFTPLGLSQAADGNGINGADGSRHAAGLIRAEDTKSQLFAAFTSLGEGEQYDAVLTGLCAKLLENESVSGTQALEMLKDPLELLDEMNRRRIRASPRSIMALIDVRRCALHDHAVKLAVPTNVSAANGCLRC